MSKFCELASELTPAISNNDSSGRFNVLLNWAKEIKRFVENPGDGVIKSLIGKAAMVECGDLEDCLRVLPLVASQAGMQFIKLTQMEGGSCLQGESLIRQDLTPTLVYIPIECFSKEDGSNSSSKKDGVIAPTWSELSDFLESSNAISPLIIITCSESFTDISTDLRAVACFDKYFTIRRATPIDRAQYFIAAIGKECFDETISQSLERTGALLNSSFPGERRIGLLVMAMKRLAYELQRPLTYRDLLGFAARGTGYMEEGPKMTAALFKTAVHEAGHSLVAMVDSDWKNIPDYVSIKSGRGFEGIMIDSYTFLNQQQNISGYLNTRHSVRVSLAGRVAEEIILGFEGVDLEAASSDLEVISGSVRRYIARCGMSPEMEVLGRAGDNLSVVVGAESGSESAHVETLARQFVKRQYENTLEIVRSNRKLLEQIIEKLQADGTIYQEDLLLIVHSYRIGLDESYLVKAGHYKKQPNLTISNI